METEVEMLIQVRAAAQQKVLFLPHALRQMLRPDRMIRRDEVRRVITKGEVIEEYPKDIRGHSCLLLGFGDQERPIHVVCAPREDYLAIISAYLPDVHEWSSDFRKRVEK
jgi:ethanolamine utilization protein EutP (predicted NTPase)